MSTRTPLHDPGAMTDTDDESLRVLKKHFGYDGLRGEQARVVRNVLEGRDVMVTAPTGHGKSMCFQLPALVRYEQRRSRPKPDGCVAIVVSPLLSLLQNQVAGLRKRGIPCALLSSSETDVANRNILASLTGMGAPPFCFLYVTAERLDNVKFRAALKHLHRHGRVSLIAIDEAHCISQWGHDFRKAYSRLGAVKDMFPTLPVIALTATATKTVRQDIISSLHIPHCVNVHTSFLRVNIRYECRYLDNMSESVENDISDYIQQRFDSAGGVYECGIVYAHMTDSVEHVAANLVAQGIPAAFYHGKMTAKKRKEVQADFESGKCPIIVATTAFGMGIDVSAIRYIIHHSIPKSVESFYQETGRAGRDGKPSESILYYSDSDAERMMYFARRSAQGDDEKRQKSSTAATEAMMKYCTTVKCRRVSLLAYFDEAAKPADVCGAHGCDVCADRQAVVKRMRVTAPSRYGQRSNPRPRVTTPAADFQTARSMMKATQRGLPGFRSASEIGKSSDEIGGFSSGDDRASPEVARQVSRVVAAAAPQQTLRELAVAEAEDAAKLSSRMKRPRDRLQQRLLGAYVSPLMPASSDGRKRRKPQT